MVELAIKREQLTMPGDYLGPKYYLPTINEDA